MKYKLKLIHILMVNFINLLSMKCESDLLETDDHGIPYIALISSRLGQSTGVLIHPEWILTSAYSLVDRDGLQLHDSEFQIGVAFTTVFIDNWNTLMKYKSKKVIVHESYRKNSTKTDIGLIQTDELPVNKYVRPINMRARPWSTLINKDCFEIEWKRDIDPPNRYKHHLASWKVVARHGEDACPCIKYLNLLKNYVCLKGMCGCTFCSSNIGGALICEMELVGIKHQIVDCRKCEIGQLLNSCPQQSLYRMYTYVCPYRRWISKYVTSPKDLKYDVVCSHFVMRRNKAANIDYRSVIFYLLNIFFVVRYCLILLNIKIF